MNENQRDTEHRPDEGKQVQQELERQLREFGDTMSDAFRHGFEGRGEEIGDRVWDVGRAAVDAANYGINAAGRAVRKGQQVYRRQAEQAGGNAAWARQIFGMKNEKTPVETLRESARKRRNAGIALLATGITFAAIFGLSALGCAVALGLFEPSTVMADLVANGDELTQVMVESGAALGSFALGTLQVCAWVFSGLTLPFVWMITAGAARMKAGKRMAGCADLAEEFDYKKGISVEMLADLLHQKKQKTLKQLQRYIRKSWLTAWLDEKNEKLYLTVEDYRAAQEEQKAAAAAASKAETQPKQDADAVPLNLEVARSFTEVLKKEKALMQDERAVEELDHMQKTTQAICDWLEAHPESLPKARRFAEYYIPTTLKLLHTYNDVQGQQGENAEAIRRDIAGILHTLNQAYDNLYDKLLSDVALDVSSEIAALQGMLANDGLTGEGML